MIQFLTLTMALWKRQSGRSVNGRPGQGPVIMRGRTWRHLLLAATAALVLAACRNEDWKEIATLKTKGYPVAVAWASDDVIATISDFGREVKLWNADGTTLHDLGDVGRPYTENSLGFLNDGRNLLTPYTGQAPHHPTWPLVALSVWDTATGTFVVHVDGPEYDRKGPGNFPDSFVTSPDGKRFALITHRRDSVIVFRSADWRIERIIPTRRSNEGGYGMASSIAFSPDGRHLAIGAYSAVGIVDLDRPDSPPDIIAVYDDPAIRVTIASLAFSPDGAMLATGASYFSNEVLPLDPDRVRIWRLHDHALVAAFKDGMEYIPQMSWNADGRHLAAATRKTVQILTPLEPEFRPRILHFDKHVMSMAFSPSGRRLAVAAGPVVSLRRVAQ